MVGVMLAAANARATEPATAAADAGATEPATAPIESVGEDATLAQSSFLDDVSRLLESDPSDRGHLLDEIRGLVHLKAELERAPQNYAAHLAGSPPRTPQLLLEELGRLRAAVAQRDSEIAQLRTNLAERDVTLARAMSEIGRVLEYQQELRRLRAELGRARAPSAGPMNQTQPPQPDARAQQVRSHL